MDEERGNSWYLYFCATTINLAFLTIGTVVAWTSPSIPRLSGVVDPKHNPLKKPITPEEASLVACLLPLTGILSIFVGGFMTIKLGPKRTLLITSVPVAAGYILIAVANQVWMFYLARIFCGLSIGPLFLILPNYLGEISEKTNRGTVSCFLIVSYTLGNLLIYCVGPYLQFSYSSIVCLIPIVFYFILTVIFVPDSPYYLLSIEKFENAEKALIKLRGKSADGVQTELSEMKIFVKEVVLKRGKILDLFKSKPLLKGLGITSSLIIFQQCSGVNVILFYLQNIFLESGSTIPPEICSIIIGIVQFISSLISPIIVDRLGRKCLLYVSGVGGTISLISMGCFFYLKTKKFDVSSVNWLPIVSLVLFILAYTVGFGPIPFAIQSEIFPANYKGTASIITVAFRFFLVFITTKFFPNLQDSIGMGPTFWLFCSFCLISIPFTYFLIPETKGKSFEEIQILLGKST